MAFIQSVLISIVAFVGVLSFIVTIHELGHFLVARAFGTKIDRFSVGFGKALLSRTDKHGIEWRIARWPIGGYVMFAGDADASSVPDHDGLAEMRERIVAREGPGAERAYLHFKPVWQRALIVMAGPAANFILAFVLFTIMFSIIGEQMVRPRVFGVTEGSPAAAAGFQPQDLIVAVNGREMNDSNAVTSVVMLSAGDPVRFTVDRGGQRVELVATPERRIEENAIAGRVRVARIGLDMRPLVREDIIVRRLNPIEAAGKSVTRIGEVLGSTLRYLGRIFTGRESGDLLNGPIGIAKAAGGVTEQAAAGIENPGLRILSVMLNLIQFAAIVSIGIGFVNLLPIPRLDGGHLLFYAYEAVAKRPVPARVQELGYGVGLALVAGLMLFATWHDLQKLSLFKFLGGIVS